MLIDAVRLVTDWLQDATYGVNEFIPTVAVDNGVDTPPLIKEFADATRDLRVFHREEPSQFPALWVMQDLPAVADQVDITGVKQIIQDLPIAIRYITENTNTMEAVEDCGITLQAVIKSMNNLGRIANRSSRTRNSTCLVKINSISSMMVEEDLSNRSQVLGAVVVSWEVAYDSPLT